MVYMIAPSTSSPVALVPHRVECLMELSQTIVSNGGVEINDILRLFVVTHLLDSLREE